MANAAEPVTSGNKKSRIPTGISAFCGADGQTYSSYPDGNVRPVLRPAKRWLVKCIESGMYLADLSLRTVTVTTDEKYALPLEFVGADRLVRSLSENYPTLHWQAVAPVEG